VGRNAAAWNAKFRRGLEPVLEELRLELDAPGSGGVAADGAGQRVVILAVVQVVRLFSSDAWNNITFTAGEVKNPKRNIPLSLILGTGFVLTIYFLVSLSYLLFCPCTATRMARR